MKDKLEVHQMVQSRTSIPDSEGIWHVKARGGKNRGRLRNSNVEWLRARREGNVERQTRTDCKGTFTSCEGAEH